jgi:hypothetical protein
MLFKMKLKSLLLLLIPFNLTAIALVTACSSILLAKEMKHKQFDPADPCQESHTTTNRNATEIKHAVAEIEARVKLEGM